MQAYSGITVIQLCCIINIRHDDEEEEYGPGIKPPQAKVKKDKHKHKHKREKRRTDDREKERYSSQTRRAEPQSRGLQVVDVVLVVLSCTLCEMFSFLLG